MSLTSAQTALIPKNVAVAVYDHAYIVDAGQHAQKRFDVGAVVDVLGFLGVYVALYFPTFQGRRELLRKNIKETFQPHEGLFVSVEVCRGMASQCVLRTIVGGSLSIEGKPFFK